MVIILLLCFRAVIACLLPSHAVASKRRFWEQKIEEREMQRGVWGPISVHIISKLIAKLLPYKTLNAIRTTRLLVLESLIGFHSEAYTHQIK